MYSLYFQSSVPLHRLVFIQIIFEAEAFSGYLKNQSQGNWVQIKIETVISVYV